ncbi:hypothetical protein D3C80_2102240 [compost metagenome]
MPEVLGTTANAGCIFHYEVVDDGSEQKALFGFQSYFQMLNSSQSELEVNKYIL